jgi:rhodanese-related sulfurtransferase
MNISPLLRLNQFLLLLLVSSLMMPQSVIAAGWQWMAPQRVTSLVKEGSGLWLVDVRSEPAFAEGHIEGAVNIPAGLLATRHLPKGKILVLVDDSLGLRKGREAAELLMKNGHDKVFLLEGGLPAWLEEGHPVAGKGSRQEFRSVMPDDIAWAQQKRIPLRIFDLRDKGDQALGPVAQAVTVEGKTLTERLEKVKTTVSEGEKKGIVAKLEKPTTVILVFPTAVDPRPLLERSFRGVAGDVRYLEGGYAAWAARPDKNVSTVGACPTCPKGASGGKK